MNVEEFLPNDLAVQKAVVESLAADKAEQAEQLASLQRENISLKATVATMKDKMAEMQKALEKVGDVLAKNAEMPELSNKVSLLDRNLDLNDRFDGESRDQVLEVIREAHNQADRDGRVRRAQILESVLVVNEPAGNLTKKRVALKKLFAENANILSGPVIAELEKNGILYKNGEEYLLPEEIIKRIY